MRAKITSLSVFAVLGLLLATPVWADILYSNGATNGTINAYRIEDGPAVSDSFNLSANSDLTGVQVGLWVNQGDIPTSVEWSIGSTPFGSDLGSGTASLSNVLNNNYFNYDVYNSIFALSDTLSSGTYWLTLQNATSFYGMTTAGGSVWWDVNDGPSQAWITSFGGIRAASEAFTIYGTTTAVPEPATLLLLGTGLAVLFAGRKMFRRHNG